MWALYSFQKLETFSNIVARPSFLQYRRLASLLFHHGDSKVCKPSEKAREKNLFEINL